MNILTYKNKNTTKKWAANNIVLAIVGLTVLNSTLVILLSVCANVVLTFFKYPTIAKPKNVRTQFAPLMRVMCNHIRRQ